MNNRTMILSEIFLVIASVFLFFAYLKSREFAYLLIFILIFLVAIILGIRIKFNKSDD